MLMAASVVADINHRIRHLLQVKLRRSYPLISVKSVEYNKKESPLQFKLVFPNYFLFLQADTQQETQGWVDHIISGDRWNQGHGLYVIALHLKQMFSLFIILLT